MRALTFFLAAPVRAALAGILSAALSAQDPASQPTFRADVTEVRVDVVVLQNRQPLTGLTQSDFRLLDEDQPREITSFGFEKEPLTLLLLLDVSGSMQPYLKEMAGVANAALAGLNGADRVCVMSFAARAGTDVSCTPNRNLAAQALKTVRWSADLGNGTAINRSILDAVELAANEPATHSRMIAILTDNRRLNYQLTDAQVLEAMARASVTLNAILTPDAERPKPGRGNVNPDFTPSNVFLLAEETGGAILQSGRTGESLTRLITELRARYRLSCRPAAGHGLRRVRVELTPAARKKYPKAIVRARGAYYATATPAAQPPR